MSPKETINKASIVIFSSRSLYECLHSPSRLHVPQPVNRETRSWSLPRCRNELLKFHQTVCSILGVLLACGGVARRRTLAYYYSCIGTLFFRRIRRLTPLAKIARNTSINCQAKSCPLVLPVGRKPVALLGDLYRYVSYGHTPLPAMSMSLASRAHNTSTRNRS